MVMVMMVLVMVVGVGVVFFSPSLRLFSFFFPSFFPSPFLFSHGRIEGCGGLQCHGKSVPGLNISFTFSYSLLLFSSVVPTLKLFPHLRMWVRCWPPVFTAAGSIRAAIFLLNDALPKTDNYISDVRDVTNSIHAWVCVARRPRSCVGGVMDATLLTTCA